MGVAMKFAPSRGWLGGSPNPARAGRYGLIYSEVNPPGGGGTPFSGLNGDVPPDRVWFSEGSVLNGVLISSVFVLNGVRVYVITTSSSVTL